MKLQSILYPTDFSEHSQEALRYAIGIARDYGARLIVLHAVESLGPENVTFGEAMSQLQPDSYRRRLWDDLHQIQPADSRVHVEYLLSDEDPLTAILHTAAKHECDLIIMGSHGRHGLRRLVEGSVTEQVVRAASCPVLVVKARARTKSPTDLPETDSHARASTEK